MISIIVPVYKVELELPRCIESLTTQTYPNIEIILVDDGSPDKCPEICDYYASLDKRIRVSHKLNGGLSDARNEGLLMATGEYVLYVDSDDYIDVDTCNQFQKIVTKTHADIIAADAVRISQGETQMYAHTSILPNVICNKKDYVIRAIRAREWYAPACFYIYRRQFLMDNHLMFVKGLLHEDMEMLPRVFLAAEKIVYLKYTFYFYIFRENSIMTGLQKDKSAESMSRIYAEWKKMFDAVEDKELRTVLYGFLVKCYMTTCRNLKLSSGFEIEGLNSKFILRYALNPKEKIKASLFVLNRKIYVRL